MRAPGDSALEMNYRSLKRLAERYQAELFSLAEVDHTAKLSIYAVFGRKWDQRLTEAYYR